MNRLPDELLALKEAFEELDAAVTTLRRVLIAVGIGVYLLALVVLGLYLGAVWQ